MPARQGRRWCFTINNYTDEEKAAVYRACERETYAVVGEEIGSTGTPHLQGFIIFQSNKRLTGVKSVIGTRAHCEVAIGTTSQAADYCKKEGNFSEFGTLPRAQGKRNDLLEVLEWSTQFEEEKGRRPESPDFAKEQPQAYIKYPRLVKAVALRAKPPVLQEGTLNEWQNELKAELDDEPDDRSILFYVDRDGGRGKSWFCRWMVSMEPEKVQVLSIGKRDDLAYMIDSTKSIFLFNIPRGCMEMLQYPVLEMIKDRMVSSPKYMSQMKCLQHNSHVVVFCNEFPEDGKLTADRVVIRMLD